MENENADALESRSPEKEDLVNLCQRLNELQALYVIVGGFAIMELGYVRATEDIDLLIQGDRENQKKVRQALEILPDRAVREVTDSDLDEYMVVRVCDEIVVDLMIAACGLKYEEVIPDAIYKTIEGVRIPFASASSMWKMKQTVREKDVLDREFLKNLLSRKR